MGALAAPAMITHQLRDPADRCCCPCVADSHDLSDDNRFSCWPRRVVLLVYFLIISAHVVVLYVSHPIGWPPILIGGLGGLFLLTMYTATACSDPGIVFKNDYSSMELAARDVEDPLHCAAADVAPSPSASMLPMARSNAVTPADSMECGICQFQRPKSARHCSYCGVCVDELDHHCPWTGKCIGKRNIKTFYLFLHALCFQFYYLVGVLVYYLIYAVGSGSVPHGPSF